MNEQMTVSLDAFTGDGPDPGGGMSASVWLRSPLAGFARVYVRPLERLWLAFPARWCELPRR